jgi:CRP-like cAMP-binding protein
MQTHIPPQLNLIRERDERHNFSVLRDRSDEDTLRITQDLLAEMLGAQRPSITNAARELEHAGLIERGRREVTILDRQGLIKASCECYQLVRERVAFHLPKTYT